MSESATLLGEPAADQGTDAEGGQEGAEKGAEAGAAQGENVGDVAAQGGEGQGAQTEQSQEAEPVYEFAFGEGVEVDQEMITELTEIAKGAKIPPEAAQKIAELGVKQAARFAEALESQISETHKAWREQAEKSPDIGGDKLEGALASAKRALDQFGSDDLRAFLNESGLGNHPEVIRTFARVGEMLADDKLVTGREAAAQKPAGLASILSKSLQP